ncbi:hypothetical protein TPA0905_14300 [Streptomyces olivaceus]|nr:hypothetical protein TPA0905_14300 [Streptomyces olivaceus]
MQLPVAQPQGRVREDARLPDGEYAAGHADPGQGAVVGGVQPQRTRAGVTAVPQSRCGLGR